MIDVPLDQVRTLLAVVDTGTFDAAAAALHVTPSAVSQRIKALEQRTGRVLVLRTKPVRPTESGQVLVRFARQLAALERDTQRELGIAAGSDATYLPIAVNADSLATWFLPALTRVPQDPPICFDLHREDESHTAMMLREGRVMAAVTSAAEPVPGCTARSVRRAICRSRVPPSPSATCAGSRIVACPTPRSWSSTAATNSRTASCAPSPRAGRPRAHCATTSPPPKASATPSPRASAGG